MSAASLAHQLPGYTDGPIAPINAAEAEAEGEAESALALCSRPDFEDPAVPPPYYDDVRCRRSPCAAKFCHEGSQKPPRDTAHSFD